MSSQHQRGVYKFNDNETTRFLELYSIEKILYDPTLDDYRDRDLRAAAADRISQALNIPGFGPKEVIAKFKNLRSSYCQELKKISDSERSGSGPEDIYKPKVFWFEQMNSFIRPFVQQRTTHTNMTLCDSPIHDDSIQGKTNLSADCDDTSNTQDSDVPSNPPAEPVIVTFGERNQLKRSISKQKGIFQAIAELKKLHKMINKDQSVAMASSNNSENQFDIYGRSVAAQLKSIPLDRALMAQSQIQDILSQHAVEYYREKNSMNPSKHFDSMNVNK